MRLISPFYSIFLLATQLPGITSNPAPTDPATPANDVLVVSSTLTVYEDATGSPVPAGLRPKKSPPNFFQANQGAIIGGSVAGGIIVIGVFTFVIYKIRQSNRRWEDEEYLKTSSNPFKSTLDQYHVGHT